MSTRSALLNFAFWCVVALLTNVWIYVAFGADYASQFFGAWVSEKLLSTDNLWMMFFIFSSFAVPLHAQAKALRWGIIGVVVMRGVFILIGVKVIEQFHFVLYFFAVFLVWASYKIVFAKEEDIPQDEKVAKLKNNWLVRFASKKLNFTDTYDGEKFFSNGKPTLLLMVVLIIEGTDLPFAFDSLPVAMAFSQNFWIVMSSNLLAVLGLRAIYFLIVNMQERFAHMKYGIALLLLFAAVKIVIPIQSALSIGLIVIVLGTTIGYSLRKTRSITQVAV
mgnify:FL=1